ncbi:Glucan 1,3-beta-glucosidase [Drechslerella dactyloides]|uniref:glucan 1,3-beta-glucosidase n=1 Tax=Drechslerella dactyloides TaxID=74499 RepID=A0AAD6IST4_DREDA|nr:Glucan 1,3-beta-glucosidase [Drechslerella dactyloides]
MKAAVITSALLMARASAAPAVQLRSISFDFANEKVRGVNLGGWLVLEPWITPSLWADWSANPTAGPVDEYKLCKALGKDACLARLQAHWSTWLTEQDFKDIKTVGLNTVRIPIGYWAFQPNPDGFVNGQVAYLDKAIGWARSAGLKVWIDLHGAPGSQNGFDNSGLRDQTNWQYGNNVQITLDVLSQIAQKYAKPAYQDVVVAIELLNEPGPNLNMDQLGRFYMDGFGKVREVSDTFVTFSDAFKPPNSWNGLLSGPGNNVIVDHHRYQMFSEAEVTRALNTQISVACNAGSETSGSDKYVVIGEWSGAMTDCARWLNGFGRYSRYEGKHQNSRWYGNCSTKGDLDTMDWAKRQEIRKYIEAQLDTYEKTTNGWIFWTWKAEEGNMSDDWNYSKLYRLNSLPATATIKSQIYLPAGLPRLSTAILQSTSAASSAATVSSVYTVVQATIVGKPQSTTLHTLARDCCKMAIDMLEAPKRNVITGDSHPVDQEYAVLFKPTEDNWDNLFVLCYPVIGKAGSRSVVGLAKNMADVPVNVHTEILGKINKLNMAAPRGSEYKLCHIWYWSEEKPIPNSVQEPVLKIEDEIAQGIQIKLVLETKGQPVPKIEDKPIPKIKHFQQVVAHLRLASSYKESGCACGNGEVKSKIGLE